jgi:PIN domain
MAIYLDANVFPELGSLPSLGLATLIALAGEHSLKVCVPEIVLEEVTARHQRGVESAQQDLQSALRTATRFWDVSATYLPDPSELALLWRERISALFEILPADEQGSRDGLLREIWRRRPARDGAGARDAVIWNCVVGHHCGGAERGFFVSENVKDFATSDGTSWHEQLAAELVDCQHELTYCRSLEVLFSILAAPSSERLELAQLNVSLEALGAVAAFVDDRRLYATNVQEVGDDAMLSLAGPVAATAVAITSSRSHIVGNMTIVTTWTEWQVDCQVGLLRRFAQGGYAQSIFHVSGVCRLQMLAKLDAGTLVSAEVTNSGKCDLKPQ